MLSFLLLGCTRLPVQVPDDAPFVSLRMDVSSGFCPSGEDCDAFIELFGEGTIRLDDSAAATPKRPG